MFFFFFWESVKSLRSTALEVLISGIACPRLEPLFYLNKFWYNE